MKYSTLLFFFTKISLFCAFLYSMNCFWFWNFRLPYINIASLIFLSLYAKKKNNILKITRGGIYTTFLFLLSQYFTGAFDDPLRFAGAIIYSILILCLLSLEKKEQKEIFLFIYNTLSLILAISLVCFFLVLAGVPIPNLGRIVHPTSQFYWYINYLFVIIGCYDIRFNGIFCEPGHLGMIIAFLIYIDGFKFNKKSTIILFITLLCTLSLAGYVLLGIGYFFHLLNNNFKKTIINILKIGCIIPLFYIPIKSYNNGNNLINELIFQRLEYDETSGTIAGDNRASNSLKSYYNSLTIDEFLFGVGQKKFSEDSSTGLYAGSGYRIFIITNGIISVLITFFFYLNIVLYYNINIRKEYIFLLIIYSLAFIQRTYPFWTAEIFPFILANSMFQTKITNKKQQV